MSFLLSLFNIFLNCNRKRGIIVKIEVVIDGKRTIIGGRRGIIGTSSADRAPTDECSADAVGMHMIIYMATGDGRGIMGKWPEMALIIISRYDFTISGLDLCVAGCEIVVSFPKICLISNIMSPFSSSGNSEGVAISQPRVEACSASTLGIHIIRCSNAVSVALSRRRYPQQDNGQEWVGGNHKTEHNAYG